jgi:hypothetical protein
MLMQEKWKNRYITNVHTSLTKKNILIVKVQLFLTVIYLPSLNFTEMHYRFWQVFWTPYSTRTEILNEGSIGNRNIKFQNKYLVFFSFSKSNITKKNYLTLLFFISRCQYYYLLFYLDVSLLLFNKIVVPLWFVLSCVSWYYLFDVKQKISSITIRKWWMSIIFWNVSVVLLIGEVIYIYQGSII